MKLSEFKNTPLTDFTDEGNVKKMKEALEYVQSRLGREYPSIIGGEEITLEEKFSSFNPSRKGEVVGVFQEADPELADRAVRVAAGAFESWKRVSPEERAGYLFKAAERMRQRQLEMAAWQVYEVGKSWVEADADVAEAIDFLEFYGREMIRYAGPQPLVPVQGEKNELRYIPLGVGAVIPPWNFPGAIMVGMASASLVAGNTVVLKPSSDSPTVAAKFVEILGEVGLPDGVVNFLPGPGRTMGDTLIRHPMTRFITFTGSKEVGLRINRLAAEVQEGQIWIKRVIAEMGGKDAIIVDSDTDMEEAVRGVAVSAYGFQGQKCSACSRAIVLRDVYDDYLDRLVGEVGKITVGPPVDRKNYMGPVINEGAMRSILEYIDIGRKEGRLLTGGEHASNEGWFIQPTVFADVDPDARIAREEIFGPVLSVIRADDFDHAIEIANDTEYGLTGAVYTRSREKIEQAASNFHVGNLYINRKCTGALVGAHPFGGFNMSGTDSKAGGRDYLLLLTQAKSISEKI
jgi:1-pyrroline-5-carboxylate dehydrogenase